MHRRRFIFGLAVLGLFLAGCSGSDQTTEVHAVVAPTFSHEGLTSGDAIPGATLRLYQDDTEVLEVNLDDKGSVVIAPDPGTYDLQIEAPSSDPLCFWGDTVFDVTLPSPPITIEIGFICAGG